MEIEMVDLSTDRTIVSKPSPTFYENAVVTILDCVNWLAALAIFMFSIFTYVRAVDTTMFDMTQYCDDERFNNVATPVNMIFPISVITFLFLGTSLCLTARMLISNKLVDKEVKNTVHFILGLILTWDICAVLQNMISYPAPYFYQDEDLRNYYCGDAFPPMTMTGVMKNVDEIARESFPSIFLGLSCYIITYLFIFVYFMDCIKSYAFKILILLIPSLITLHYMILLWKNKQNHIEDLITGALIGISMALFVMNDFHPLIMFQEWMLAETADKKSMESCRPPIISDLDFSVKEIVVMGEVGENSVSIHDQD